MYKIVILGCENSHANSFLNFIIKDKLFTDIEVLGVYSDDLQAAQKLNDEYGVYVMKSYDEFVGKVDGVVNTARHGDNHYKFCKPYIESGVPMFIDKPITCTEEEAVTFMKECKKNKVKVCGGSMLVHAPLIQKFKKIVKNKTMGDIINASFKAPLQINSPHGGIHFYIQHVISMMTEVFGYYPNEITALRNDVSVTATFNYDECNVVAYASGNLKRWDYEAMLSTEKKTIFKPVSLKGASLKEFKAFYSLLKGGRQKTSYEDFIAPVFIINAIVRSLETGTTQKLNKIEI